MTTLLHQRSRLPFSRRDALGLIAAAIVAGCQGKAGSRGGPGGAESELILCGGDEVFILALGTAGTTRKIWSWRAAECEQIPEALRPKFKTTDDCKPVEGGKAILISSSGGAIALVDRQTGRSRFSAPVVNAHSVEMLPGGRIAAAASTGTASGANRVILFDQATGRELAEDALLSAHGVVWDEARQLLWALGKDELRAYTLATDARGGTAMKMQYQLTLPDSDGHDLSPVAGSDQLFISTGRHCWMFDRRKRQIAPYEPLKDFERVKSYSVHPATRQECYIQASAEHWWSEQVHLRNPVAGIMLPGQRLYKARWMPGER